MKRITCSSVGTIQPDRMMAVPVLVVISEVEKKSLAVDIRFGPDQVASMPSRRIE